MIYHYVYDEEDQKAVVSHTAVGKLIAFYSRKALDTYMECVFERYMTIRVMANRISMCHIILQELEGRQIEGVLLHHDKIPGCEDKELSILYDNQWDTLESITRFIYNLQDDDYRKLHDYLKRQDEPAFIISFSILKEPFAEEIVLRDNTDEMDAIIASQPRKEMITRYLKEIIPEKRIKIYPYGELYLITFPRSYGFYGVELLKKGERVVSDLRVQMEEQVKKIKTQQWLRTMLD